MNEWTMDSRCKIILTFLMVIMPLASCNSDSQTEMLMKRMENLERREEEKSITIKHLTRLLLNQDEKLQSMQVTVDRLQNNLVAHSNKLLRKDKSILRLTRNQAKLSGENRRLSNLIHMNIKEIQMVSDQLKEKIPLRKGTQYAHTQNNELMNKNYDSEEHKTQPDNNGFIRPKTIFSSIENATRRHLSGYPHKTESKRFVMNAEGPVAFHAVIDKGLIDHMGTNENIKFETILLNLGNGYHSQHGLFIAPKSGLYLFSTSVMSYVNTKSEFTAELTKNGVTLARVFGHGDSGRKDQGSVTVVLQLNVGDEVWIRHSNPADGAIYGKRYTSFTGILMSEI